MRSQIGHLGGIVERDSSRYRAALVLLALTVLPPRIDHLACRLRIPREFVARCIRRLIDNGVLQNDALVRVWSEPATDESAFWADVSVALGLWTRRDDPFGNLEWAKAGSWMSQEKSTLGDDYEGGYMAYEARSTGAAELVYPINREETTENWIGASSPAEPLGAAEPKPRDPEFGTNYLTTFNDQAAGPVEADPLSTIIAYPEVIWLS